MLVLNKTQIIGRITNDLELKTTPNGNKVLSFTVATNYVYKDQQGQKVEETEFHNVVAWGKQAETIAQYFVKGQEIYVEGRLKTRNWEDKDTAKKMYRTEIILNNFEFGQKPNKETPNERAGRFNNEAKKTEKTEEVEYPDPDIDPADIPF